MCYCHLLSLFPPLLLLLPLLTPSYPQGPLHYENSYYPDFLLYWLALWASYLLAEQQTISFLLVVKSSYTAACASLYLVKIIVILRTITIIITIIITTLPTTTHLSRCSSTLCSAAPQ